MDGFTGVLRRTGSHITWVNMRDSHGQSVAPPIPRQELCIGLHVPCGHVKDQAVTGKGVDVFLPGVPGAVDVT